MLIRSIFHLDLDLFVVFCDGSCSGLLAGWLDFGCLSVGVLRLSYLVVEGHNIGNIICKHSIPVALEPEIITMMEESSQAC